jgi:hypothetical protein
MKASLAALLILLIVSSGSSAGTIQKGAIMDVKPNSIWFEEVADLTHWQALKKAGNAAALASYQDAMLGRRDAWQFIYRLTVKILNYRPTNHQVSVEMRTEGRYVGTKWVLDDSAIVQ